jgi:hypothetical protein
VQVSVHRSGSQTIHLVVVGLRLLFLHDVPSEELRRRIVCMMRDILISDDCHALVCLSVCEGNGLGTGFTDFTDLGFATLFLLGAAFLGGIRFLLKARFYRIQLAYRARFFCCLLAA